MEKTNKNQSFGLVWRYLRESRKMSINELAILLELSCTSINNIEKGRSLPMFKNIVKFCEVVGISVTDMSELLPGKELSTETKLKIFDKITNLNLEEEKI